MAVPCGIVNLPVFSNLNLFYNHMSRLLDEVCEIFLKLELGETAIFTTIELDESRIFARCRILRSIVAQEWPGEGTRLVVNTYFAPQANREWNCDNEAQLS